MRDISNWKYLVKILSENQEIVYYYRFVETADISDIYILYGTTLEVVLSDCTSWESTEDILHA